MAGENDDLSDPAIARERVGQALRAGDFAQAERLLRRRIDVAPDDSDALVALADVAYQTDRPDEAAALFRRALQGQPDSHNAAVATDKLSALMQQSGHFREALTLLEDLPSDWRSQFQVRARVAALLGHLGRRAEEIAAYRSLLDEQPDNPGLWQLLAKALNYAGRTDESVAALRRAIESAPGLGAPWWGLADLKSFRFDDSEVAAMESVLAGANASDSATLHFALGRAFEIRGEFSRSFDHYDAGNRICFQGLGLAQSAASASAAVDEAIEAFSGELFERRSGAGEPSDAPIFIIGLQRSGSTLLEQILASHSMVEATLELPILPQLLRDNQGVRAIAAASPDRLAQIGADYVERSKDFRRFDRPHFTDKQPANWALVGMIRLILPNARIIDARRDPMSCGFSNFKQLYSVGGHFSYSLESIGRYYRDYLRLMRHFDRVQPGAIHRCIHEKLVDDLEGEVRRLLEYLGLEFEPSCLGFHKSDRTVNTPSAEQVRRPIDRESGRQWRHYEQWLRPLKEALGPDLDNWRD